MKHTLSCPPMGNALRASVIVTTYNRPDALRAVLEGLAAQTCQDFECIVADDGSGPETRAVVEAMQPRFDTGRLKHVWHPDEGFRLSAIRNRAIEAAVGAWIVFIDGDCVPLPRFIEGHLECARTGWITRGSRVLLSQAFTEVVIRDRVALHEVTLLSWNAHKLAGHVNRVDVLRGGWRDTVRHLWSLCGGNRWRSVRGCNIATSRESLYAVGGFDERFRSWGLEDSEFCIRMQRYGARITRAPASTTVLHLWHRESAGLIADLNASILLETQSNAVCRTAYGLPAHPRDSSYLQSGRPVSRKNRPASLRSDGSTGA